MRRSPQAPFSRDAAGAFENFALRLYTVLLKELMNHSRATFTVMSSEAIYKVTAEVMCKCAKEPFKNFSAQIKIS